MRKCSIENLGKVLACIAAARELYLPVNDSEGRAAFTRWTDGSEYSRSLNTVRSPKDFFFPQTEDMMSFRVEGQTIEIKDPELLDRDFVVFGVRACDVRAFDVLDNVFLKDPADSYYSARRDHGTIVAVACDRPGETCFCGTFGIDPAEPRGDVSVWMDGGFAYWQANTEKGEKLLASISDLTDEAADNAADGAKETISKIMAKLPLAGLTADGFGPGKTQELFDDPKWAELSESCLGCGTCTFVCPTCQCYDIRDFNTGRGVIRFRCWDSCMYSEFTKMSAGQPRLTQKERFRQRFMHKLVYYPENNGGMFSCVGCGRCVARCPISMNIVKVMRAIGGEKHE